MSEVGYFVWVDDCCNSRVCAIFGGGGVNVRETQLEQSLRVGILLSS